MLITGISFIYCQIKTNTVIKELHVCTRFVSSSPEWTKVWVCQQRRVFQAAIIQAARRGIDIGSQIGFSTTTTHAGRRKPEFRKVDGFRHSKYFRGNETQVGRGIKESCIGSTDRRSQ